MNIQIDKLTRDNRKGKATGKFATRKEWEDEVQRLLDKGTRIMAIASIVESTHSSIGSYARSRKKY